jgi:hypothetical protein
VIRALPGAEVEPGASGCDRRLAQQQGQWVVIPLTEADSAWQAPLAPWG